MLTIGIMLIGYLEIGFLFEATKIIGESNFKLFMEFGIGVSKGFTISKSGCRVGAAVYAASGRVSFGFTQYTEMSALEAGFKKISYSSGGGGSDLNIGRGLMTCKSGLFRSSGSSSSASASGSSSSAAASVSSRFLVVLIASKSKDDVKEAAKALKDMKVTIICVVLGQGADKSQVEMIATSSRYIVMVSQISQITSKVQQVISLIKGGTLCISPI